jgi:5-methyltetrahydrofolate--homocysteine methyltransferase
LLRERIVLMDGAMGTMIQQLGLTELHFRGERFQAHRSELKGNNELLCLTQPEVIARIHTAYLQAGADIIETNTFGANAIAQADYGLEHLAREMNVAAARLARKACDERATPDTPRWAAGAIGPTPRTASISPDVNDPAARNTSFDALRRAARIFCWSKRFSTRSTRRPRCSPLKKPSMPLASNCQSSSAAR